MMPPAAVVAQAPIIQPGSPGEAARELSADEAIRIAPRPEKSSSSKADGTSLTDP